MSDESKCKDSPPVHGIAPMPGGRYVLVYRLRQVDATERPLDEYELALGEQGRQLAQARELIVELAKCLNGLNEGTCAVCADLDFHETLAKAKSLLGDKT
jgi:hypothetical protein